MGSDSKEHLLVSTFGQPRNTFSPSFTFSGTTNSSLLQNWKEPLFILSKLLGNTSLFKLWQAQKEPLPIVLRLFGQINSSSLSKQQNTPAPILLAFTPEMSIDLQHVTAQLREAKSEQYVYTSDQICS